MDNTSDPFLQGYENMTRKIEEGCFAVIRHSGQVTIVGHKHIGYRGSPATFDTVDGEYQASELQRITKEEYARRDEAEEFAMWKQCGF
jgi:hypothetical protein